MFCKKTFIVCLLLVSLLVSVVCPCLISCSSSGETDAPARESNTAAGRNSGTDIAPEPALGYYIGNTSTGVFHRPDCNRIPLMNPANKVTLRGTRDTAIARGYTPCGICLLEVNRQGQCSIGICIFQFFVSQNPLRIW